MPEINLDFRKSNNKHFYPLFWDKHRYLVLRGGSGSGKSHFAAQKIIYRCLTDGIRHKFLILRKTQGSVRKSCFALIGDYLEKWGIQHEKIDLYIKFEGCELIFSGLDDPLKIKSIERVTGVFMEEATEFTLRDFMQLDLRLRGKFGTYKQIILAFNPEGGKLAWIFKKFFDIKNEDAFLDHSTWRDNKFIDKKYTEIVLKSGDATFLKIYDKGEWAELRNKIYSNYEKRKLNIVDVLRRADTIYAAIDFGFNNPCVFLLIAEMDTDVYVLKEYYKNKITNNTFINDVSTMLYKIEVEYNKTVNEQTEDKLSFQKTLQIYPDSAEPDRIKEFANAGWRVTPANKRVKDGIDETKRRHIIIDTECVNTCDEIGVYSYIEDKDGNVLEEPVKFKDHCMDCLRYGVYSHMQRGIVLYVS